MSLLGILFLLIVLCAVIWAVRALLAAFAVPQPLATVIWVVVVLICVIAFVDQAGVFGGGPLLSLRR